MSATLYGIKNCDTIKRARAWLDARGVEYTFHDYKSAGIDRPRLERWCGEAGWETLLNRAGTTFRKLPESERAHVDRSAALRLMLAQPSLIKRPVLEIGSRVIVGFTPAVYDQYVAVGHP
jgi:arsenate reductase